MSGRPIAQADDGHLHHRLVARVCRSGRRCCGSTPWGRRWPWSVWCSCASRRCRRFLSRRDWPRRRCRRAPAGRAGRAARPGRGAGPRPPRSGAAGAAAPRGEPGPAREAGRPAPAARRGKRYVFFTNHPTCGALQTRKACTIIGAVDCDQGQHGGWKRMKRRSAVALGEYGKYASLGISLVLTTAVYLFLGYRVGTWLDGRWGTEPTFHGGRHRAGHVSEPRFHGKRADHVDAQGARQRARARTGPVGPG